MKVKVEQNNLGLTFHLIPDDLDAIPPLSSIWFLLDQPVRIERPRLCLLAFVLTADLVGNHFSIDDIAIPSHLASLLQHSFEGHELHFSDIDNVPQRIVGEPARLGLMFESAEAGPRQQEQLPPVGWLLGRRSLLGLEIVDSENKTVLSISTNLALHASIAAADPALMIEAATFLLSMDLLRPAALKLSSGEGPRRSTTEDWLREVGGRVA